MTSPDAAPRPLHQNAARRARWAVGLMFFVNGAAFASWVSRIPALRETMGLSNGALGSVLFAMSIGVLGSFPLTGKGTQVLGSRLLTLLAGALLLLLLPAPFMVGIVPSLVLVMLEFGAANGAMQVAMNVFAVDVQAFVGRPIMSSLHGLWSAGGLVGATVGSLAARGHVAPLVHLGGVSAALGLTLAAAALLLRGVRMPRAEAEPDRLAAVTASFRPRRPAGLDRLLVGLGLICFCSFLTEGAIADWSAVFLRDHGHASEAFAALGYAVFAGAMTTMRLAGDRFLQRFGITRPLRLLTGFGALALAAALVLQMAGIAMAAFLLLGLGLATIVPSAFAAAARHAESRPGVTRETAPARAAQTISLVSGFGYTGLLIGPPLIGWLAQGVGLSWALGLLVALVAVISALVPLLEPRVPRQPAPSGRGVPIARS